MSALAQERGAVNLGQGFPDFDCDPKLVDAVDAAMRAGLNQYPPMAASDPARAHRREDGGALRPPLRPGRARSR
jgi:aspartate/methionine/tyrosine aminotransferase